MEYLVGINGARRKRNTEREIERTFGLTEIAVEIRALCLEISEQLKNHQIIRNSKSKNKKNQPKKKKLHNQRKQEETRKKNKVLQGGLR
jgi:hypothetical protein